MDMPVHSPLPSPEPKRQKLPSSTQILCLPCLSKTVWSDDQSYHIYIIDLNSPGNSVDDDDIFIPMAPNLQIERRCFDVYSCCVFKSTLYMFGTCHPRSGKTESDELRSVATIDLSDYLTKSDFILEKDMLSYIPPMHGSKIDPHAIPTPDGKILVFSYDIVFDIFDDTDDHIDFELYDPDTKLWLRLPGIHPDILKHTAYKPTSSFSFPIYSFAFLDDFTFFIQTGVGQFELNLRSPNTRGWQTFDGDTEMTRSLGYVSVFGGDICFNSRSIFDISVDSVCSYFPITTSFDDTDRYEEPGVYGVTLLDGDGECNFFHVRLAKDKVSLYPHLTIEVYRCDLSKYREDRQKLGGTETERLSKA